ncbi:DnaB-like helicase C-terminal domain-containing protein [Streptomyces sp. AC550_RSS872]|uniref:DnaB-like helicase C-terminal domain-containing protein n=1 Tax=Streptomyces sp. AC550_RSS872 TaxID=2823689 RepID=UPI001C25D4B7|nr:DnaB-like helicase C-terminal domain-containing protein [Streptomyces sp. AC550_RSS872]
MGATKDAPENWVWGPYPVHDSPCKDRLAHPDLQQLLDTDGYARTSIRLDLNDPHTEAVLEHWQKLMASPWMDRFAVRHWSDHLSGPEGLEAQTPWPDMDEVAHLAAGRLTCLGTRSRSREAQAGYDIAVHNAARGMRVTMFAPDLTPRNTLPNLTIYRDAKLTPELIRDRLETAAHRGKYTDLVVIDRLQVMTARDEDPRPLSHPEQVEEVSIALKHTAMDERLKQPPILLMARLERPRRDGHPLDIEDLGIAAELEYHADTLALLDRTHPSKVDVFISKDRSGPAPRHLTVAW